MSKTISYGSNQTRPKRIIVGIGELLWDLLPAGRQLGGAPTNFAYHAQALGAQSFIVSTLGSDPLGRDIITLFNQLNLDPQYLTVDSQHPTGTVTVQLDAAGKPNYTIHENVAWDHIAFNDNLDSLARIADAVCFGSLAQRSPTSRATIQKFLKNVQPCCLRVFDINLRQAYYSKEVIADSLALSNVLKLNDEELPVIAKMFDISGTDRQITHSLLSRFSLCAVALTRGSHGSLLCTADQFADCPGYPVPQIADTVGAGDAFTAAMTIGLLNNNDFDSINQFANRLAAFVCSQHGATPPIREKYPKAL